MISESKVPDGDKPKKYKKSYKNYISKIPWVKSDPPPRDKPILFDLASNIFQEVLVYIREDKNPQDFLIDFYTNNHIEIIKKRVEKKYEDLINSSFKVILVGRKSIEQEGNKASSGTILTDSTLALVLSTILFL